jgi:hypothetical protein
VLALGLRLAVHEDRVVDPVQCGFRNAVIAFQEALKRGIIRQG